MKKYLYLFAILTLPLSSLSKDVLISDVGFHGENVYLNIEPFSTDQGFSYFFNLCRTSSGECKRISNCSYRETSLEAEIQTVKNENVKQDFEWIFMISDYSSEELLPFIDVFVSVLKKANPKCDEFDFELARYPLRKNLG